MIGKKGKNMHDKTRMVNNERKYGELPRHIPGASLKVHKREKFFGSDLEFFTIL